MGYFQTGIIIKKAIITNGATPPEDYISGFVGYDNTLPSLFPASGILECLSIQDAINAGIDGNHEDETPATATLQVNTIGATGDIYYIYTQEPQSNVLLCAYTQTAADTIGGVNTLAASIAAAIVANQVSNGGYGALSATDTVTITARPGLGIFLNTGSPLTLVTASITFASTITQYSGGVASLWDVFYYHISEFFRMSPNGIVWVGLFDDPGAGAYTFQEVATLQNAAQGAIRRVGVYAPTEGFVANIAADVQLLNTVCKTLDTNKQPLQAFLAENLSAVTDLSTLPSLAFNPGFDYVSVNISQDGAAQGFALFKALGKSITNIGAMVGVSSSISVAASIAQPIANNNLSNGRENDVPAFANGTLFSAISPTLQTQLDNYAYIYTGKFTGYNGTYFSGDYTCSIQNTNYSFIYQNLTEQKIERSLYIAYLPYLNGGIQLNQDGTIFAPAVQSLNSVGDNSLLPMLQAGEISAEEIAISPTQNVLNSGKLIVTLYYVSLAIARNIEIDINSVSSIPS